MKAKKISRSVPSTPAPPPTREQIQALAQAIWIDRGSPQGCDVEIWLEAERQLTERSREMPSVDAGIDPARSSADRIDREMDRIVSPPEQRSPTSL